MSGPQEEKFRTSSHALCTVGPLSITFRDLRRRKSTVKMRVGGWEGPGRVQSTWLSSPHCARVDVPVDPHMHVLVIRVECVGHWKSCRALCWCGEHVCPRKQPMLFKRQVCRSMRRDQRVSKRLAVTICSCLVILKPPITSHRPSIPGG